MLNGANLQFVDLNESEFDRRATSCNVVQHRATGSICPVRRLLSIGVLSSCALWRLRLGTSSYEFLFWGKWKVGESWKIFFMQGTWLVDLVVERAAINGESMMDIEMWILSADDCLFMQLWYDSMSTASISLNPRCLQHLSVPLWFQVPWRRLPSDCTIGIFTESSSVQIIQNIQTCIECCRKSI